ncbi:MAG: metal ABC transporter ATP-binding protein [Acidimicrobiaceae bacterium]|nr:metal ABC transporter ATP-binding protein [Acidimicrobiaceae bacterium]
MGLAPADPGVEADVLTVEGVGVRLGGRQVLSDVGFRIAAGELTGLIGSNGAGKTTLFRVILGLLAPSRGRVLLDGRPLRRGSRRIGYVPQKISLDPDAPLRARDLVALGLDGHRLGFALPSAGRRRRVEEMLEAVDATHFADSRVGTLSGGEAQRVMIAHALISGPKLLLADEPLANLDISSGQEVTALLTRLAREQNVAVLISAHEINPLLPVMDRVVYLAGGRAASGPTGEVVTTETLSRLYGHPVEVLRVHGRVLVVAGPSEADEYSETAVHHGGNDLEDQVARGWPW